MFLKHLSTKHIPLVLCCTYQNNPCDFNLRSRIGWFSGGIGKENCAKQNDEISLYDPILDVIFHFLLYLLYMFSLVFFLFLPFYNLMQGPSICKDVVFICL